MQEEETMPQPEAPQAVEPPVETAPEPAPAPAPEPEPEPEPLEEIKGEKGPDTQVVFVTTKGYGIRTSFSYFRKGHRASKGVKAIILNEKNGELAGMAVAKTGDTMCVVSKKGQAALFPLDEINLKRRAIFGVRIMKLDEGDKVIGVTVI